MDTDLEFYAIEDIAGEKCVHYRAYTYASDGDKPLRAAEPCGCIILLSELCSEAARLGIARIGFLTEFASGFTQHISDFDEAGLADYVRESKEGARMLDLEDVARDTPCGEYWFRPGGEEEVA